MAERDNIATDLDEMENDLDALIDRVQDLKNDLDDGAVKAALVNALNDLHNAMDELGEASEAAEGED